MTERMRILTGLALALGLSTLVAACAGQQLAECEPGLGEISEMGSVTPPGC
ncbi:hypothetical protein EV663_101418 [Rhodovulum bhavnagarense]|uniref:Lipoprotein n=1 Tax=Rhodovulum bhavnagarense TaxID=992286 RepID=A0A4R2RTD1_9RHOB|nr:hypothetical protein [Rhodovulum bhavnagarense]TCP63151.1 hypothetical protein EV663_101418 [Rhodovulum bhavnagarense]